MIIFLLSITFNTLLVSGSSLSDKVRQTPAHMLVNEGETAKVDCSHSIDNYNRILWYKQSKNKNLQFLGYMYINNANPENTELSIKMDGNANKDQTCTLKIEAVRLNSSAVYFCAASSGWPAYFGQGTKLTVLEPDCEITKPTVQVLPPSTKECRDQKDNARKKTIVCVATGFYPDHVQVSWQINGNSVTNGVATDEAALREDKFYKITSRLRVLAKEWYKPDTKFTCTVSFFDGTETTSHSDSINGEEAKGEALTKEKYLRITQTAKFSYSVFIIKSITYGAFVGFLVWKLQSSAGKQNN